MYVRTCNRSYSISHTYCIYVYIYICIIADFTVDFMASTYFTVDFTERQVDFTEVRTYILCMYFSDVDV